MDTSALGAHLDRQYGVGVVDVVPIESVFRVNLRDGSSWIARVFPADRPTAAAEGDADILLFVEAHGFPAERVAAPQPVSTIDDQSVLVTSMVAGENGRENTSPALFRALGELLGRLHTLPSGDGATARPAGSWHHLSPEGGGRDADVSVLRAQLVGTEFEPLREELEAIDLLVGLPEALHHPDFVTANAMIAPDGPVLIDWTGAGRAPRVAGLGMLLLCTDANPELVEAVVEGYRRHVQPEPEELEHLVGAVRAFAVVIDCWMGVNHRAFLSHVIQQLAPKRAQAETIAAVALGLRVVTGTS